MNRYQLVRENTVHLTRLQRVFVTKTCKTWPTSASEWHQWATSPQVELLLGYESKRAQAAIKRLLAEIQVARDK